MSLTDVGAQGTPARGPAPTLPIAKRQPAIHRLLNSRRFLSVAMLVPALFVLAFLFVYPVAGTVVMAFQNVNLGRPADPIKFVGLDNFAWLFDSDVFWVSLGNTVLLTVVVVTLELTVGMFIALLLVEPFRGVSIVRGIFIVPWVIPNIVLAWLMRMYLQPRFGLVDQIIGTVGNALGIHKGYFLWDWLSEPSTAMLCVVLITTFKDLPFIILVLLSGLQGIPRELGEAARIDGANAWQEFFHVTLPSLRVVVVVTVVFKIISTFNTFDLVWLLTGGGPGDQTRVLALEVYNRAFVSFQMSRAASITVLMLLVLGVLAFALLKLLPDDNEKST